MGGLQAKWLLRVLALQDELLATRKSALAYFQKHLPDRAQYKWVRSPSDVDGNAYLAVLRFPATERDTLISRAGELGVDCKMTYPETLSMQRMCREDLRVSDLKVSNQFVKEVVNLPLYSFMKEEEVKKVVEVIGSIE
jgi:dTDP-4-amino-4,6-dideoxygalactose transaminase